MNRPFRRTNQAAKVFGVCGGLAYGLGAPAWVLRIALLVAFFGYGVGFGVYILLALVMPTWDNDPADYRSVASE